MYYNHAGREVAIVGFGRMVEVYSSKQKPKRLTIYCDDFRWVQGARTQLPHTCLSVVVGCKRAADHLLRLL